MRDEPNIHPGKLASMLALVKNEKHDKEENDRRRYITTNCGKCTGCVDI
jgi:hypothetical protein